MDTLTFLRRVLPTEGNFCAWVLDGDVGGCQAQKFFSDVEALAQFLSHVSGYNEDVYYAVSSFVDPKIRKPRTQDNVQLTKLFALDIDVGKKPHNSYPNKRDALLALGDFLKTTGLPFPMVVSSGMGFHVYWVLTRALAPAEWQPIADALKLCWQNLGLVADSTVTADSARILRPVGTRHTKSDSVVTLLRDAPDVDPEVIWNVVQRYATAVPKQHAAQPLPAHLAGRTSTLINNINTTKVEAPAVAFVVASKCKQIAKAIAEPDKVSEPTWYAMLGVAAHTTDPEATAKLWSKGHPNYNETATLDKLAQWKANTTGPATCERFRMENPAGCNGCVFKDKIKTPVSLGRVFTEEPIAVSAPSVISNEVPLPRPFKRTADGIKLTIEDTDIDVCPFDIYPVGYGRDEALGYETVRYHWNRPHVGWVLLSFRQALLTQGHRDFATTMADNGIVLPSAKHTEMFQNLMRSYMDELRKRRTLSNLYASMGWKEDDTLFVIGDTVVKQENGAVIEEASTLSAGTSRTSADMYGVAGSLQSWSEGTRVLEMADMPHHIFALNMGFAAPLFAFTGLKGLTVSLYGPTGGGKTLIQYWIQSIFGDPEKLHFAAKFTQNSLFSRLALYGNLPMTIDEATMFDDKNVGDFLYWVSQGRDKARLTRSAEEKEAKTWATPVIVSTNVSLQSKLVSSGIDTDAQMARLLEVTVPAHALFKKDSMAGQKIYAHLMSNYGHAGRAFIRELISIGADGLRKLIDDARQGFQAKYSCKFRGEERYWEQAIILSDVGAEIAQRLGLIKYDHTIGTRWVLDQLGALRSSAADNKLDTFDILSEYLNENADCAVTVMHTGTQKPMVDMSRSPRGEIRARFDVYRAKIDAQFSKGILFIDRTHFRKWLSMKGSDFKTFMKDIQLAGVDMTPKSGRIVMGKDTPTKVGMLYVVGIDLTHPRLVGSLSDADDALDKVTSHLRLVSNNGE
jgi:hypothetical protein